MWKRQNKMAMRAVRNISHVPTKALRNTLVMICNFQIITIGCAIMVAQFPAWAEERLTVFAASSLKGALDEVTALYEHPVTLSYGGSGLIARQVALGAPADLVILANQEWMGWLTLEEHPKIMEVKELLGNTLVLIGPTDAEPLAEVTQSVMLDRIGDNRLAIGMTQGVPAGIYGRQWLENTGLWSALQLKLAETDNVRAALALVSRKEAPLGIVYASDAKADATVKILYEIPSEMHDEIVYPMAVIDTKNAPQAADMASFLTSETAMSMFAKHGFKFVGVTP